MSFALPSRRPLVLALQLAFVAAPMLTPALMPAAQAQAAARSYSIPAGTLSRVLSQFAAEAGFRPRLQRLQDFRRDLDRTLDAGLGAELDHARRIDEIVGHALEMGDVLLARPMKRLTETMVFFGSTAWSLRAS